MDTAITRKISASIVNCELTHLARSPIDVDLARRQHMQYERALVSMGLDVMTLPEQPDLPDSVFVEDTAVVFDELAVITRPGAESRRAEVDSVAAALEPFRSQCAITEPATLDGGDVLTVGKMIYVGISKRSNVEAVQQLVDFLSPYNYTVRGVLVKDVLHLKSAVTQVGENLLLINSSYVDREVFSDYELIEVDPSEPNAANALYVNGTVLYSTSYPHTRARLEERGLHVITVDASEVQKAEGALTCCSLVFSRPE